MDFLNSKFMPVADHFMAFDSREVNSRMYVNRKFTAQRANEGARVDGEVCEICYGYFVGGKKELWRHVGDEHGADRKLRCPVPGCGRRFFARSMINIHGYHHYRSNDDRPFTCELCGHFSSNRLAFYRHVTKSHSEIRDALCGVCHLYKGDVPSLVDHVRRRHGDVVGRDAVTIRCDVCGKRYGNYRFMYAHRLVHGVGKQ